MSSPTRLRYVVDPEPARLRQAQSRWQALSGRADALAKRCRSAGYPDIAVRVGSPGRGDSEGLNRECDQLEQRIAAASSRLEQTQFDERTQRIATEMRGALAELERRERAQAAAREAAAEKPGTATAPPPVVDYSAKVMEKLASLKDRSAELEDRGEEVLRASDPDRARLLFEDLKQRIADANTRTELLIQRRSEVAELRALVDVLPEPDPVRALLDAADSALDRGEDPGPILAQAHDAATSRSEHAIARSTQEFVRQAVIESFAEIGCEAIDVGLETPETLFFRQSDSHGVRVRITDGTIDLRTVRLDPATGTTTDRDADDQLCRTLDSINGAMSRHGVRVEVEERTLPGTESPEIVRLSGSLKASGKPQTKGRRKSKPVAREQGAG